MVSLTTPRVAQTTRDLPLWNGTFRRGRARQRDGTQASSAWQTMRRPPYNPVGLVSLTRAADYENTRTEIEVERLADINALTTLQRGVHKRCQCPVVSELLAPSATRSPVGFSVHRFLDYHEVFTSRPARFRMIRAHILFPVSGTADFTGTFRRLGRLYVTTRCAWPDRRRQLLSGDSVATRTASSEVRISRPTRSTSLQ